MAGNNTLTKPVDGQGSVEYYIDHKTLHSYYKQQLMQLRNLMAQQTDINTMELFLKWLKIFNNISKSEIMARNCLCLLMIRQLLENDRLEEPFTNLDNCTKDLNEILTDMESEKGKSASDKSRKTFTAEKPEISKTRQRANNSRPSAIKMQLANLQLRREINEAHLLLTQKKIETLEKRTQTKQAGTQNNGMLLEDFSDARTKDAQDEI